MFCLMFIVKSLFINRQNFLDEKKNKQIFSEHNRLVYKIALQS